MGLTGPTGLKEMTGDSLNVFWIGIRIAVFKAAVRAVAAPVRIDAAAIEGLPEPISTVGTAACFTLAGHAFVVELHTARLDARSVHSGCHAYPLDGFASSSLNPQSGQRMLQCSLVQPSSDDCHSR